jgi:hypothetical protein
LQCPYNSKQPEGRLIQLPVALQKVEKIKQDAGSVDIDCQIIHPALSNQDTS